eukprot:6193880-Pleurochrysis_carterae.AAC.1
MRMGGHSGARPGVRIRARAALACRALLGTFWYFPGKFPVRSWRRAASAAAALAALAGPPDAISCATVMMHAVERYSGGHFSCPLSNCSFRIAQHRMW